MKIVIFTRTGFHHTSFINRLQERFDIACVVREAYPAGGKDRLLKSLFGGLFEQNGVRRIKDALYLKKFHERFSAGFRYHRILREYLRAPFDVVTERAGTKYLDIKYGEINNNEFGLFLKGLKPDIIAVLGSSIIKPHIISIPSTAMINLHSGLSPHYRGTWSYGWPIVNNEPEYIGVTVHHVNKGIDTGDIIRQTRPALEPPDDLNTIFLKVIAEGIELVVQVLEDLGKTGLLKSYRQPENAGRIYMTRDLNAAAARLCLWNLEEGLIGKYNSCKKEKDSRVTLCGYVPPERFK